MPNPQWIKPHKPRAGRVCIIGKHNLPELAGASLKRSVAFHGGDTVRHGGFGHSGLKSGICLVYRPACAANAEPVTTERRAIVPTVPSEKNGTLARRTFGAPGRPCRQTEFSLNPPRREHRWPAPGSASWSQGTCGPSSAARSVRRPPSQHSCGIGGTKRFRIEFCRIEFGARGDGVAVVEHVLFPVPCRGWEHKLAVRPESHDPPIASGRIPVPVSRSPEQCATRSSDRSSAGTSLPARGNRSAQTRMFHTSR